MDILRAEIRFIIHEAILARSAISSGNFTTAIQLIEYLVKVDEKELSQILQLEIRYKQDTILRNIEKIAREIKRLAILADNRIKENPTNLLHPKTVLPLLDYIIKLANIELITEQKWKKAIKAPETELIVTVAMEAAFAHYVHIKIDPYLRGAGQKIDSIYQKLDGARELAKHTAEKAVKLGKKAWESKYMPWNWLSTKERSKEIIKEEMIQAENQAVTLVPEISTRVKYDTFENLFSTGFSVMLLAVFGYVLITKNIPRYWKRRREVKVKQQLVQEMYVKVASVFEPRFRVLEAQASEFSRRMEHISQMIEIQTKLIEQDRKSVV